MYSCTPSSHETTQGNHENEIEMNSSALASLHLTGNATAPNTHSPSRLKFPSSKLYPQSFPPKVKWSVYLFMNGTETELSHIWTRCGWCTTAKGGWKEKATIDTLWIFFHTVLYVQLSSSFAVMWGMKRLLGGPLDMWICTNKRKIHNSLDTMKRDVRCEVWVIYYEAK